jgi:MFS family permease
MLIALAYTYGKIGKGVDVEAKNIRDEGASLGRAFWIYCIAVLLNTLGLIPVALILYVGSSILQPLGQQWIVPLLYVVVQVVDAPMALVSGHLFDRVGVKLLALPFVLAIFPAFLAFYGGLVGVVASSIVFGLVLGMQESIYRAAIADLVPLSIRGTAYGIFNTALGLGTLASGVIFGFFIDRSYSATALMGFAMVLQVAAIITLRSNRQLFSNAVKEGID